MIYNCKYYLTEIYCEITQNIIVSLSLSCGCLGQDEWVIFREIDRNIKLVRGMVSGGPIVLTMQVYVCTSAMSYNSTIQIFCGTFEDIVYAGSASSVLYPHGTLCLIFV